MPESLSRLPELITIEAIAFRPQFKNFLKKHKVALQRSSSGIAYANLETNLSRIFDGVQELTSDKNPNAKEHITTIQNWAKDIYIHLPTILSTFPENLTFDDISTYDPRLAPAFDNWINFILLDAYFKLFDKTGDFKPEVKELLNYNNILNSAIAERNIEKVKKEVICSFISSFTLHPINIPTIMNEQDIGEVPVTSIIFYVNKKLDTLTLQPGEKLLEKILSNDFHEQVASLETISPALTDFKKQIQAFQRAQIAVRIADFKAKQDQSGLNNPDIKSIIQFFDNHKKTIDLSYMLAFFDLLKFVENLYKNKNSDYLKRLNNYLATQPNLETALCLIPSQLNLIDSAQAGALEMAVNIVKHLPLKHPKDDSINTFSLLAEKFASFAHLNHDHLIPSVKRLVVKLFEEANNLLQTVVLGTSTLPVEEHADFLVAYQELFKTPCLFDKYLEQLRENILIGTTDNIIDIRNQHPDKTSSLTLMLRAFIDYLKDPNDVSKKEKFNKQFIDCQYRVFCPCDNMPEFKKYAENSLHQDNRFIGTPIEAKTSSFITLYTTSPNPYLDSFFADVNKLLDKFKRRNHAFKPKDLEHTDFLVTYQKLLQTRCIDNKLLLIKSSVLEDIIALRDKNPHLTVTLTGFIDAFISYLINPSTLSKESFYNQLSHYRYELALSKAKQKSAHEQINTLIKDITAIKSEIDQPMSSNSTAKIGHVLSSKQVITLSQLTQELEDITIAYQAEKMVIEGGKEIKQQEMLMYIWGTSVVREHIFDQTCKQLQDFFTSNPPQKSNIGYSIQANAARDYSKERALFYDLVNKKNAGNISTPILNRMLLRLLILLTDPTQQPRQADYDDLYKDARIAKEQEGCTFKKFAKTTFKICTFGFMQTPQMLKTTKDLIKDIVPDRLNKPGKKRN